MRFVFQRSYAHTFVAGNATRSGPMWPLAKLAAKMQTEQQDLRKKTTQVCSMNSQCDMMQKWTEIN